MFPVHHLFLLQRCILYLFLSLLGFFMPLLGGVARAFFMDTVMGELYLPNPRLLRLSLTDSSGSFANAECCSTDSRYSFFIAAAPVYQFFMILDLYRRTPSLSQERISDSSSVLESVFAFYFAGAARHGRKSRQWRVPSRRPRGEPAL